MRRIIAVGVCGWLGLFLARPAAAQPQQAVRVDVGLFSAVGELGVVYQADLLSYFAVEGGLGLGFTGVQLSGMVKGAVPVRYGKLTFGVGVSGAVPALGIDGAQTEYDDGEPAPSGETIPWVNVDAIGFQQWYGRTVIAGALGVTAPLRSWRYEVAEVGDTFHAMTPIPQARFGVGRAF